MLDLQRAELEKNLIRAVERLESVRANIDDERTMEAAERLVIEASKALTDFLSRSPSESKATGKKKNLVRGQAGRTP